MAKPLADDPLAVTIHRLSNGLTVYISPNKQTPRVSAWIAVRAGSRNDPAASTGLAHYLEHMMFKGSDEFGTINYEAEKPHIDRIAKLYDELRAVGDNDAKRGEILKSIDAETQKAAAYAVPNELDQLYSAMGITGVNAFTSNHMTVYISDVPKNRLDTWAELEAERFADPVFRLFYPELEAVYEEKNRSMDNPEWRAYEAMSAALYPKHPYGTQPTIGVIDHLKNPAYADMVAFYDRWYVANNMAIVLAGDVDAETVLPMLERRFSRLRSAPLTPAEPAELPALEKPVDIEIVAPGANEVSLTWGTVDVHHEDVAALKVMDALMSNPAAGLLMADVALTQKLPEAGSELETMLEAGHYSVSGTARDGQSHEDVQQLLLSHVQKLKAGEFTQDAIDAVVLEQEMQQMRAAEENRGRMFQIAGAFLDFREWEDVTKDTERLRKVTREDVMRVANTYLGENFVRVRRVKGDFQPPKMAKPEITPIPIDPTKSSAMAARIRNEEAEPLQPEFLAKGAQYEELALPAGPLFTSHNDTNELFAVEYAFDFGYSAQPLLCMALELVERSGAEDKSAEALQQALWRMGTSVSFRCDADRTEISVSGIERHMDESMALVHTWLTKPNVADDTLAKLVQNTLSQRANRNTQPRTIARALASYATHGKSSDYLQEPATKAVSSAKRAQLTGLVRRLVNTRHNTTYFGPRTGETMTEVVALGARHRRAPTREAKKYRKQDGVQIFFTHQPTAQAMINIAIPNPPLDSKERPLSELFGAYVGGGMGGLVFQEIREARGLAYSAYATHAANTRPQDDSAVVGFVGTQADKTIDALTTMLGLIRELDVKDQRFAQAKNSVIEEYRTGRIEPRRIPSQLSEWQFEGEESDPRAKRWPAVQATAKGDLSTFAKRFGQANVIISIMGNKDRISLDKLRELGTVTLIEADALFAK